MVARPGVYQATFNAGELSPDVGGNTGLKNYYAGLSLARNIEPVPQGGFDLPPRSTHRGYVRFPLGEVYSGGAASADLTSAGVIAAWTLPAEKTFCAVDVSGLTASVATPDRHVVVEVQTSSGWVQIGGALFASASARTRRLGLAPAASIAATAIRLRLTVAPAASSHYAVAGVALLAEQAGAPPAAQVIAYAASREAPYCIVLTAGHLDVWRDGLWVGCCAAPWTAAQVADVRGPQRDESAVLFHKEVSPRRLLRHATDWDWSLDEAVFAHVAEVDYGDTYVNTDDKWSVLINWTSEIVGTAVSFIVSVDGVETPVISADVGWSGVVTTLKAHLEAMPNVEDGITVVDAGVIGGGSYSRQIDITFTGAGNTGQVFDVGGRSSGKVAVAVTTSRTKRGKKGGEAVMSAARGWPRTGAFYQQRLALGGFAAKGSAFCLSRSGEYFDLNIELNNSAGAVLVNLDTDGAETIVHFAQGRHLCIFTTEGEFYLADRAVDRQKPLNIVSSSRIGANPSIPVVEQEGGLLFVSREGTMVYAANFNDIQQAYVPEPISLLASHLFVDVTGAAIQKSALATDAQRYWLPRADGVLIEGLLIRGQDVTAFVRWETDGAVRRVVVDGANKPWLLVERQIGGAARLCVETLEDDTLLDAAVGFAFATPTRALTGLGHLEGASVWAEVDGYVEGPFTVADGALTLPTAGSAVTVGRWTPPLARTMPLARDVGERTVLKRPARVHTVQMDLLDTTSIAIGANGLAARDVTLARAGDPAAAPTPAYSGQKIVTGLVGFSDEGLVEITQTRPGRLRLRDLTIQARV